MRAALPRRVLAELLGTGLLVAVVVGSGIAAQRLSPGDAGLQLLENATATAGGLAVLILVLGPVSGAHLNPVVSLGDWLLGRADRTGLTTAEVAAYLPAQVAGAVCGAVLADAMFDVPVIRFSTHDRGGAHLWLGEVVATAGLLLVILALARSGRTGQTPWAVGAYIGTAYWFTSSTAFANPAVAVGRAFTDTFAGIAPGSLPGFVLAELVGAALGLGLAAALYPGVPGVADRVVVPREAGTLRAGSNR